MGAKPQKQKSVHAIPDEEENKLDDEIVADSEEDEDNLLTLDESIENKDNVED